MTILNWDSDSRLDDVSGVTADGLGDHSGLEQGYTFGSLTDGLVAYYTMDGGQGRVLFDGALGNHGQINGASWNGSGQVGSDCLSFDGADDYVDVTSVYDFFPSPITVSLWVNKDSTSSPASAFDRDSTRWNIGYENRGSDGFEFSLYDGSFNTITSGVTATGTWHHFAAVFDGSTMRLFHDGSSVGSQSSGYSEGSNQQARIGDRSSSTDEQFDGLIDHVTIHDRALSQPEIQALASLTAPQGREVTESAVPSQADSGVSRYEFENDITDSWGSNDGTDNTSAGFVEGVYGQAKDFDGNDDYLSLPGAPSGGDIQNVSISAWANHSVSSDWDTIYFEEDSNNSDSLRITITNGDKARIGIADISENDTFKSAEGSTVIPTGEWHHVLGTCDGTTAKIYLDGKFENSVDVSTYSVTGLDTTAIGKEPVDSERYFDGAIDDVRIYSTTLTPIQIELLYNLGARRIPRGDVL